MFKNVPQNSFNIILMAGRCTSFGVLLITTGHAKTGTAVLKGYAMHTSMMAFKSKETTSTNEWFVFVPTGIHPPPKKTTTNNNNNNYAKSHMDTYMYVDKNTHTHAEKHIMLRSTLCENHVFRNFANVIVISRSSLVISSPTYSIIVLGTVYK